jgi:hypothetical protein
VLCALGIVAAVLLVGRGESGGSGAGATPASTATAETTSKTHFGIDDMPPDYCIEDSEHGKTSVWHWSDDQQTLVKGCPGANLP